MCLKRENFLWQPKAWEVFVKTFRMVGGGTSLVVQWLRIRLPMQGTCVRSLVWELRSHMPWGD